MLIKIEHFHYNTCCCCRCRPHRRGRAFLFVGPKGVQTMSFTINPGQKKTLTAVFSDDNNVSEPLFSLPVAVDPSGVLVITAQGTPGLSDGTYNWDVSAPTDAVVGATLQIDVSAEGDPTPGVNTIKQSITGTVIAPEDTHVVLSVA